MTRPAACPCQARLLESAVSRPRFSLPMSLDREDAFPSTSPTTAPPPTAAAHPAAWFAGPPQAVTVVIKKRRLARLSGCAPDAAPTAASEERRPRVFVLPRETATATPAEPARGLADGAMSGSAALQSTRPRRQRRRAPWRQPSPVVHIVPESLSAPLPAEVALDGGPEPIVPPGLQSGYRETLAALARVRRLVDDAERARRLARALAVPVRA